MKHHFKVTALAGLALAALSLPALSRQTGGIVEIFGRNRAETTEQGTVIHTFTEGLALRQAIIPGLLTGRQDILFWQIATEQFQAPEHGRALNHAYAAHAEKAPLEWEAIHADSSGTFSGKLSRAYLYTAFDSPEPRAALLEASGHTRVFINGMPGEGDHYDYNYTLIPFELKRGKNEFIYTYGRFGRVKSKIILPRQEIMFSSKDMTLPSLIRGGNQAVWGAVRIINAGKMPVSGLAILCVLETGEEISFETGGLVPLAVRKLKFKIPALKTRYRNETIAASLFLVDETGKEIDRMSFVLDVKNPEQHHARTFISRIDGSVQYYSAAPSLSKAENQALVLSVHGAGVEAVNQARAYKQKDWAHIAAPTNRRPFGFNWEEWGRIDALEVLDEAVRLFNADPRRIYLTGHSMGGHGAWFLGAVYPDKWAAIAPAAGYPDIIGYGRGGIDSSLFKNPHFEMIYRAALAGRVMDVKRNYLQSGVYILHGSADAVVPVEQARLMREKLGGFHNNFAYYEYPDGSHWYGDHSMDWPPLFDFLKQNTIPRSRLVKKLEFHTASPGVSASNYWITVNQQIMPYKHSSVELFMRNDTVFASLQNIRNITFHLDRGVLFKAPVLAIDGQTLRPAALKDAVLRNNSGTWVIADSLNKNEKHPGRTGGFKLAFDNHMLFVYAASGTEEENAWYLNKARFDAETFLYRGNGSIDIIPDSAFCPDIYHGRNVILYGNADNNSAWEKLLDHSPVQVKNGLIQFGDDVLKGDDLGACFLYPAKDHTTASIGVLAGTGIQGMKALYANDYFSGITGFPDLLIFHVDWIKDGLDAVKISGFFGYDWSIENGNFITEF